MIDSAGLVGLTVAGLSLLASAVAMLLSGAPRTSPVLLGGCAVTMLVGTSLDAAGQDTGSAEVLTASAALGCLALATYPRPRWRHPVDVLSLAAIVGSGTAMVLWSSPGEVDGTLGVVLAVTLVGHTWWRIEVTSGAERRALVWMAASVGVSALAVGVISFATESMQATAVATATVAIIGPAMYVGLTLPDIVDVRGVVVSVTVFAVAAFAYVAVFVPVVALLDDRAGRPVSRGAAALVGAVLAAGFHPLQRRLRGTVDTILFGHRPDPLAAATRLAGGIGEDPARALDAVCESLVLPWAELRVDGRVLATSGQQVPHTRTLVVDDSAELVVGLRPGDLSLTDADRRVLALTAPLLSQVLRARSLAADLADSRGQTIAAREEERRRLRRDLHDGLGPRLTGVAFASDAARNLVHTDPIAADEVLARLRDETATAIEEIRQIVYAMRPPALDELGLVAALRQRAQELRHADGSPVAVAVDADQDLGPLPAAVEVAAYRIVTEALTNVARHSDADRARVRLTLADGELRIEVDDTGSGDVAWPAGVGLSSMRERADELGGRLVAGATADGGRVSARLPLL